MKRLICKGETAIDNLQRTLSPPEAMAIIRSLAALTSDEAKALLDIKKVFKDSKIILRTTHEQ